MLHFPVNCGYRAVFDHFIQGFKGKLSDHFKSSISSGSFSLALLFSFLNFARTCAITPESCPVQPDLLATEQEEVNGLAQGHPDQPGTIRS